MWESSLRGNSTGLREQRNLSSIALQIENESFNAAQSKEEYFVTIAQKVFAIRRKFFLPSKSFRKTPSQRPSHDKRTQNKKQSISECVICLEDFKSSRRRKHTLDCSHVFHSTCIKKWLSRSPACPICRAPLATSSVSSSNSLPT